jgi:radical SAM superfamily enzyme YgiQ (UPF0313 family)
MATKRSTKVVLVNPPRPAGAFVHYQNPLIGVAYMAAVLEKEGYDVAVVDCPPLNMGYEALANEIQRFKPDIVGITSVTVTFSSAAQAAQVIKSAYPSALIVMGGPHVTVLDEQVLKENPSVDIIVRGEGELTILELARLVSESNLQNLDQVLGVTFRKNGKFVRNADRPLIQNVDDLPYPAYKYFPLDKYRLFGKLILPVISSRGCPFRCTFCLAPRMAGQGFRARSPKNVVDEIEWLKTNFKPDAFTFHDETFTYDKQRVFEICDDLKKRHINLPWDCSTRVDQVTKELLMQMKSANCQLVSYGVESGSQKIHNAMKKGTTVEANARAVKIAKETGMSVTMSVIIGYPGETEETLQQTLDFIRKTKPDAVYLSLATPYPGIELYDVMKNTGWKVTDDWGHCDMQTAVFENPTLPIDLREVRRKFYNQFYSPGYILRQWLKGTFYSKSMARAGANQFLWRVRQSLKK